MSEVSSESQSRAECSTEGCFHAVKPGKAECLLCINGTDCDADCLFCRTTIDRNPERRKYD